MKSYIIKKKIPHFVRNDDSIDESADAGIPPPFENVCHSERSEESLVYLNNTNSESPDSKTKRFVLTIICMAIFQTQFMSSSFSKVGNSFSNYRNYGYF